MLQRTQPGHPPATRAPLTLEALAGWLRGRDPAAIPAALDAVAVLGERSVGAALRRVEARLVAQAAQAERAS